MRFRFRTGLVFASWAMLLIFGCHKKKPPVPAQEPPPTISTTTPEQTTPPTTQEPQNPQPTQEQPQTTTNDKPAEKPSPRHVKRPPVAPKKLPEPEKPATTEVAKNNPPPSPPRIVIQDGSSGTNGSGKVAGANDAAQSQATTQQLIDSTENNLRNLKRTLSAEEQTTVKQINDYLKQSKDAVKDGDLSRAHNLALKARLLSDELVKTK